jgi:hypothetical protein
MVKKCALSALIRMVVPVFRMLDACAGHASSMGHLLGQEVCWCPERFRNHCRLIAAVEKQPIVFVSGEQTVSTMSTTAASMSVAR